jgi:hypothetical protein
MASFLDQARNLAYDYSGARNIMTGGRQLGKASTFTEGLKGIGNIALGTVGFIPGIGVGSKLAGGVIQKGAKVFGKKAPPLVTNVSKKLTTKQPIKGLTASPIKSSINVVRKPNAKFTGVRNIAREGARDIVSTRGLAVTGVNISSAMADKTRTQQPSTTSTGTIQNQVTNQKPVLTVVQPNDGTLKPRTTQPPSAISPKPVAPKAPVPPARRKPEDIYSFPIKTPPRVVQPPVTTRIAQPTQPSTQTVTTPTSTTPPDTTRPRVYPDNYSGTTTFMDLNKDRIAAEAAKATEDIKRQNDYNTYLDEVKRNATLAEQQRFTQEQNEIAQRGALQQQRTQLENKEYGIPPYLEAASKRYQGGLARSQALGAIREQDIRDALSQRQMSARGRSAGTVGGLAPALLGSGLTGAGRSYKLDTRNEVLRRAEEQAALKESYDVYLAEAAREAQLAQLEDAKTRSLLIDQIRSLGSN